MSLQTGAQVLGQEVPPRASFPSSNYTTTSDSSLNHRLIEIPPVSDITYTPSSTDIVLPVASATSFWDMQNSWIRGNLKVTVSGSDSAGKYAILEQGGIHSLFREIEISAAATGVVLDRIQYYNVQQAMETEFIHSADYVDTMLADELDAAIQGVDKQCGAQGVLPATSVAHSAITDTAITSVGAGDYLQPGDLILIQPAAAAVDVSATVNQTTVNTAIQKARSEIRKVLSVGSTDVVATTAGYDFSGGSSATYTCTVIRRGGDKSVRHIGPADGSGDHEANFEFSMRPRLGFLRQSKYFPLFLMHGGVRLTLKLDPSLAVNSFYMENGGANSTVAVELSQIRYMATFLDLHSSINTQYTDLYAGRGLLVPFLGVASFNKTVTNGDTQVSLDWQVGHRSAKLAIAKNMGSGLYNGSTSSAVVKQFPALSFFPHSYVQKWGFESGSIRLPGKEVDVESPSLSNYPVPSQTLRHMQKTFQKIYDLWGDNVSDMPYAGNAGMRTPGWAHRYRPLPGVVDSGAHVQQYPKFIMSQILGRDVGGKFSGLDLSIQPLKLNLNWRASISSAEGAYRLVFIFVYYDRYVHLSKRTGASVLS